MQTISAVQFAGDIFIYFFEMIFFINRCHNGNPTGSRVVQYITKILILYVCMFPKYSQNSTRQRKNFQPTLLTILLRGAVSSFVQIGQRKKILKNQFPIQSSTLRENLINANNLSGIVRWSYLFFIFWNDFLINRCHNGNPTGSRVVQLNKQMRNKHI